MQTAENSGAQWSPFRVVLAALVILVFGFFLWSLRSFLSPFLLFWVLVGVMWPFRGTRGHTGILITAALLTLLWVLDTTGFLLAPFVLALVLAYILDPLVDRLALHRVPRSLAILALALPVFAAVALGVVFGLPALFRQVGDLIQQTPALLERLSGWLEGLDDLLLGVDLPVIDEAALVERLRGINSEDVIAMLEEQLQLITDRLWTGVLGVGRGIGAALSILGYVVLTPVITFYLLRDYDELVARVRELLPARIRPQVVSFARDYDRDLSAYLRGQITVALIIGSLTAVGLWILQFPYAFMLGAAVAVFGLVPYVGLVVSLVPAVLIALLTPSPLIGLAKVGGVFAAAQALEGAVVSPRIVGDSVGLHPVWVVLALSVGGFFLGFLGLLLGVPIAVGIKLMVVRALEHYRRTALYHGTTQEGF